MRKHFLFFIAFLVFIAGCDYDKKTNSDISVIIEATGEIEAVPDIAEFLITVSCVDKKIGVSNKCLKAEVNSVITILGKRKISNEDFHSSRVNLDKEYVWKNNSRLFKGYKSSTTIKIIIKDLQILNNLLTDLMSHTDLSISGLAYSHSMIDKLVNDAYINALEKAGVLATRIKNKVGGKAIEISQIKNAGNSDPRRNNAAFFEKNAKLGVNILNLNVGSVVIRKSIVVQYRIKK